MIDTLPVPKNWRLAAPHLPPKGRRDVTNKIGFIDRRWVACAVVWNQELEKAEVLIKPYWNPSKKPGNNVRLRDWICTSIELLKQHLDYIDQVENSKKGENNE
jgi:hypothetical protein